MRGLKTKGKPREDERDANKSRGTMITTVKKDFSSMGLKGCEINPNPLIDEGNPTPMAGMKAIMTLAELASLSH